MLFCGVKAVIKLGVILDAELQQLADHVCTVYETLLREVEDKKE